MTLIELTVVVGVLLAMISALFVGAVAWKNGADRGQCILLIRNAQVGMRSFQNLNRFNEGDAFDINSIVGSGNFLGSYPVCPTGATYAVGNSFPSPGNMILQCPVSGHAPPADANTSTW